MDNTFLAQFYGKSQNYTDIPNHLYKDYNVKKGLRNEDGTGVYHILVIGRIDKLKQHITITAQPDFLP